MIRVTHVTTVPASLIFLRGQAAYMRRRGIELSAVSSPGEALDRFGREEDVATFGIPMERRITPLKDLTTVAALVAHFRATRPDIVHAHTPKGGLLGTLAATIAGVPTRIYHMRGLPLMGATGAKRALLSSTEWASCHLANEVICVSHSLREVAIESGLVEPERIRVLGQGSGQGVDSESRFTPADKATSSEIRRDLGFAPGAFVFGFVGRLVRDKGIHELEAAWRQVRTALPHVRLLLAGPWEPQDPVDAEVRRRLELDERVLLVGPTRDTARFYGAMDVVVLPTYREGFPNVPLEAAAMARPVIATRIPGCVDAVLDGVTGTLVPVRDAGGLAAAMRAYAENPELASTHGRAGRERVVREFRPERLFEALASTYEAAHG